VNPTSSFTLLEERSRFNQVLTCCRYEVSECNVGGGMNDHMV
jgi:hypothetical protein